MIKFFILQIKLGKITLEQVPETYKKLVQQELEKENGRI